MTNSPHRQQDLQRRAEQLKLALDQARALADPQRAHGPGWSAHAAHVGDLSVLALAARD